MTKRVIVIANAVKQSGRVGMAMCTNHIAPGTTCLATPRNGGVIPAAQGRNVITEKQYDVTD
jgi:hypothetical protein